MLPKSLILNTHFVVTTRTVPKFSGFHSERGLHIHYGKSLHYVARAVACHAHYQHNILAPLSLSPSQLWDIDDADTSIAGVVNQSVATRTDGELEDICMDKNETNQLMHQIGIKHTSMEKFTETFKKDSK
jgi:hypothetical protein